MISYSQIQVNPSLPLHFLANEFITPTFSLMLVISSHDPEPRTHFTPMLMAPRFLNSDPADSVDRKLPVIPSSDRCRSGKVNPSGLRQPEDKPLVEDIRCDGCRRSVREKISGTICCECERCFCMHCTSGLVDHFRDGTKTHSVWWDNRAKLFPASLLDEISILSLGFRACKGCMRSLCYDCVAVLAPIALRITFVSAV